VHRTCGRVSKDLFCAILILITQWGRIWFAHTGLCLPHTNT